MNKKNGLVYAVILLIAFSCNHVYKEYDKESFPSYSWKSGKAITFTPEISDATKTYKLILGMRHLYGFQLNSVSVAVKSISPSGKESVKNYKFIVKDAANNYLAKCSGDLCDLEIVAEEQLTFEETGTYTYIINHIEKSDKIPGVMEIGLIIDELK
jgi:gliding motility-associated lipoprotein GldH